MAKKLNAFTVLTPLTEIATLDEGGPEPAPLPDPPPDGSDRLLTLTEAATILGLSPDHFYRQRRPPYEVSIPGSTKRLFSYRRLQDFLRKLS